MFCNLIEFLCDKWIKMIKDNIEYEFKDLIIDRINFLNIKTFESLKQLKIKQQT